MSEFQPYENLEAVDKAQGQAGTDGKREYQTNARFRQHVEAERTRLMSGQPVAAPVQESFAGVSGVDPLGRRTFIDGEPDPRMAELAAALQGARDPATGKRLVDVSSAYREEVEGVYRDAMAGKPFDREAEALLQGLKAEAAAAAKDSNLYRSATEGHKGYSWNRGNERLQAALKRFSELGIDDKQAHGLLALMAELEGGK